MISLPEPSAVIRSEPALDRWDAIIADLHARRDVPRYVAACKAVRREAETRHLAQLYELMQNGRDFTIREAVAIPIARLDGMRACADFLPPLDWAVPKATTMTA